MAVAVAFVPFASPARLDPAAIAADFAARFPALNSLIEEPSTQEGFISFHAGGVIASVLTTSPAALGVFWSNARLLIPAPVFGDFAVEVLPDGPPLDIWGDFRVGTTGLAALGLMEIEAEGASDTPADLRARFASLANSLLENGPVVNNGDTIGEDALERIQVIHAPSNFGQAGPVMRLEYNPIKTRKSWFGRG